MIRVPPPCRILKTALLAITAQSESVQHNFATGRGIINHLGHAVLRTYQVSGLSTKGKPSGWKLLLVQRIRSITPKENNRSPIRLSDRSWISGGGPMKVPPDRVRKSLTDLFASYPKSRFFAESKKLWQQKRPTAEMIQAFSLRPEIMAGLAVLGEGLYPGGLLERSIGERTLLEISRLNECQFCATSHEFYTKALGISETPLEDLDSGGGLTPRERAAVAYARAIHADSNRIPAEVKKRLAEVFTEEEVVELTFTIGIFNALNWFNNALENHYAGEYEGTVEPLARPERPSARKAATASSTPTRRSGGKVAGAPSSRK